jgi:hypothetical protein
LFDSGVLDHGGARRCVCDRGGGTVLISLRGFVEAGRLDGEDPMKQRGLECKDNNAAIVKKMMPEEMRIAALQLALKHV